MNVVKMKVCKNCGHNNEDVEWYCTSCGILLDGALEAIETRRLEDGEIEPGTPEARWGNLFAEEEAFLYLHLPDESKIIHVPLKANEQVILGRARANAPDTDDYTTLPVVSESFRKELLELALLDKSERERIELIQESNLRIIDLNPYGAADSGISRKHAVIEREDHYFTITDLGSTNGTRLNGMMLVAYQRRVVRDGDEILLGKLLLRVSFHRESSGREDGRTG